MKHLFRGYRLFKTPSRFHNLSNHVNNKLTAAILKNTWVNDNSMNLEENILLRDPDELMAKVSVMKASGQEDLMIITDFDQTLTPKKFNGKNCPATFGVFLDSAYLSDDFKRKSIEIFEKYHKIEIDRTVPYEKKALLMHEWVEVTANLIAEQGLNEDKLKLILSTANLTFRYGFDNFIKTCYNADLPLFIISGGIGDFLLSMMEKYVDTQQYHHLYVLANWMIFGRNKELTGFKTPFIHALNKSKLLEKSQAQSAKFTKKNLILMGDGLHDYYMHHQFEGQNILTIGFMNDSSGPLGEYMKKFDVVIQNDGNLIMAEALTKMILGLNQREEVMDYISKKTPQLFMTPQSEKEFEALAKL